MNIQSIALAFRLELDFHALNNEGSGGTNVMEPRRIALGDKEYDGVSGEMVRRHVLENFVRLCQQRDIPLFEDSKGLVPSRGKQALITWVGQTVTPDVKTEKAKGDKPPTSTYSFSVKPPYYAQATQYLIDGCALCDIGGYLIAFETKNDKATTADGNEGAINGTLKRDSAFEVGWLISEHPALTDYTQHAAYSPDPKDNKLFTQNIRSGVYAGVMRIDVGRVGHNDWAWLASDKNGLHLATEKRTNRAKALLDAIEQYLLSPSGAKQAGWLPHAGGVCEGVLIVSEDGPAPFISPLHLSTPGDNPTVGPNPDYREAIKQLAEKRKKDGQAVMTVYTFDNMADLADAVQKVREHLGGEKTS